MSDDEVERLHNYCQSVINKFQNYIQLSQEEFSENENFSSQGNQPSKEDFDIEEIFEEIIRINEHLVEEIRIKGNQRLMNAYQKIEEHTYNKIKS